MTLFKKKVIVATLLMFMILVTFTYLVCMSVISLLMVNEITSSKEEIHITVVTYNVPEVKEAHIEQPAVKAVSQEPKEAPIPEPKKEPVAVTTKKDSEEDVDSYLLAQIINAEAKGEPYNGKVAVGNVVINRVNHPEFPDTIKGVIFQKGQFYPVTNGTIYNKPSDDSIKAAKEVLNGKQIVGKQALYFYNPVTSTSDWIFTRKTITDIGNHRFAY